MAAEEKCPVCGMKVQNQNIKTNLDGQEYHFCCPECKRKFENNPKQYT